MAIIVIAVSLTSVDAAQASGSCIRAGGSGFGVVQGFASFMARATMNNSAKKIGGDHIKIGKVSETCNQSGLMHSCKATASACK
jgi:hypothetical protein